MGFGLEMKPPEVKRDPYSKDVGQRTGLSAYQGISLPDYKDPYDVAGFQNSKYYGIATGESMSPWSRLAIENQNRLASQKNEEAKVKGQGMAGKTASDLARQGGLTSGARERAQEQAGKNILSMTQGNNQESANNQAGIGIDDAKQRMSMLGDATNKMTSMSAANITGQNQSSANTSEMLNKAIAADQTAKAQVQAANASRSNCVLCVIAPFVLTSLISEPAKANMVRTEPSNFTHVKSLRKLFNSKEGMRGYLKISDTLLPHVRKNGAVKKIVTHTLVNPIARRGFGYKLWACIFDLIGKVV